MTFNLARAIFGRGITRNTTDPLVSVGGINSSNTYQPLSLNADGSVNVNVSSTSKTIKSVTGTTNATATIVAAVTSKRIKVLAYSLITVVATVVTLTFKSGAGGTALWTVPLLAMTNGMAGANLTTAAPTFLFGTTAGALLELSWSASVNVTYSVSYFDDDAT